MTCPVCGARSVSKRCGSCAVQDEPSVILRKSKGNAFEVWSRKWGLVGYYDPMKAPKMLRVRTPDDSVLETLHALVDVAGAAIQEKELEIKN